MQTLPNSIEIFLNHCEFERNASFHTIKAYRLDLAQFTRFAVERCQSDDVTQLGHSHIREYARSLHHYKPRTQRRKLAALKSLFGFLEREGLLDSNPARSLRLEIRVGRILPRTVSLSVLQTFFRQVYANRASFVEQTEACRRAIRDVALFELMFSTGMRVSEISNLLVATVDLDRGAVLVRGKGDKERRIPICDNAVHSALRAYAGIETTSRKADAFFFTNRFGGRLSEQSIRMALKRHAKAAGIEKITPHVFRHTVATMLLEQGVDLRFIQIFLGHSSIVTTTIYAHVNDKSQRDVLSQRHPRRLFGALPSPSSSEFTEG
ncbi:MAG TPA: tyrosine-type recombinase/integrase [Chthoniobacterales bacterium]|nr:tyrosine-type recombinase/integrase [Chthoniobacterales bacterium]